MFNGRMRKLVLTAARNGYFFVLDRVTGEHLLTSKFGTTTNWVEEPRRERAADARSAQGRDGRRLAGVAAATSGTINWEPPAYSPDTGLLLRAGAERVLDLLPDRHRSARIDGPRREAESSVGSAGSFLTAIDYKTGKVAWRHPYPVSAAAEAAAVC